MTDTAGTIVNGHGYLLRTKLNECKTQIQNHRDSKTILRTPSPELHIRVCQSWYETRRRAVSEEALVLKWPLCASQANPIRQDAGQAHLEVSH